MSSHKKLSSLSEKDTAVVLGLCGGQEFQRTMSELGLLPGCRFEVVSKSPGHGKVLINTSRGRLALGHGMAEKIIVG